MVTFSSSTERLQLRRFSPLPHTHTQTHAPLHRSLPCISRVSLRAGEERKKKKSEEQGKKEKEEEEAVPRTRN